MVKKNINIRNNQKEEITIPANEIVEEKVENHVTMEVIDEGYNIYAPSSQKAGYRYGPSIMYYDDGSIDVWFASNANNSEWDWITYRHYDGENWSNEKIVLQPTANSMDYYSVCDPGVIYFDGYYYLGYTSTIVSTNGGVNNNLFVARSQNPDGPYEKWNGAGWGGDPAPIVYYDGSDSYWGAGEVSFVINDNKLFIYYSWNCESGDYTKVATASLCDNWPSTIVKDDIYFEKYGGQDSVDVAYLEEADKFIAISIYERFTSRSSVIIYESDDGFNFRKADYIKTGISMYAHNLGVSKRSDGHIKEGDKTFIGYAYGNSSNAWGTWALRFQDVNLITYEGERFRHDKEGEPTCRNIYNGGLSNSMIGINCENRKIKCLVGASKAINLTWYNMYLNGFTLDDKVEYIYDEDMVKVSGRTVTALQKGESEVIVKYGDYYTTFKVIGYEEGDYVYSDTPQIIEFRAVDENMVVSLEKSKVFKKQIRAFVEFDNGNWGEGYNDFTRDHWNYPAKVDGGTYYLEYKVYDESVLEVGEDGIIYPLAEGETDVKVKVNDDLSFKVHITVTK